MKDFPQLELRPLGAAALARSLADVGAPHLPQTVLSDHYAVGNRRLRHMLRTKVLKLVNALGPRLAADHPAWPGARADVLALDMAFVEHPWQPFELAWVEIQAFTSMLPTAHTLHLAQRRLHELDARWLPHDPTPPSVSWVEHLRAWVAPHPMTVLIEDRPQTRFTLPDLEAARHWWQVAVCDWRELVPADGQLYHPDSGQHFGHVWNRLILSDLDGAERRQAEATLLAANRVGWHSHPAWYEAVNKGTLADVALAEHESCHWIEHRPMGPADRWVAKSVAGHSGTGLLLRPTAEQLAALPGPRQWIVQNRFRQHPIGRHPQTGQPLFGEVRCMLGLSPRRPPWVIAWIMRISTDGIATMTGRETAPGEGMTLLYFDTLAR